jgi:putative PIN family toxin of toxin-antitoxin system
MVKKPSVFLDSSVLLAGLHSNKGGSAAILTQIKKKKLVGFISQSIAEETKRNIQKKFSLKLLSKLEKLIKIVNIKENFEPKDILKYRKLVDIKDLHVLVFAKSSKSDFLITLDKKHFKTKKLQKANLSFKIVTPKEFLEQTKNLKI